MDCNADCGCPVSRMQPICSKDGVTNFFSPCHAGCRPPGRPNVTWDHWLKTGEDSGELPKDQYFHCSCVEAASVRDQTSLASKWLGDGAEAGLPIARWADGSSITRCQKQDALLGQGR